MKYFKVFLVLLFCASCTSCSTGTTGNLRQVQAGPLAVYVKQELVQPNKKDCRIARAITQRSVFTIENNSNDFIVVRNVNIIGQLPDPIRWYGATYGSTQYKPKEDVWVYDQSAKILSSPVFASGVIAPGAGFQIERWAVLNYLEI